MDDPKELERLRNYKPSIDDLKMRSPEFKLMYQQPDTLYAFLYNPIIYESEYITVSIHRTREGAEKALSHHKYECEKEWKDIMQDDLAEFPFDVNQSWQISEITIQD